MYHNRLIPCLSLRGHGLVKTIQFNKGRYLGDPINAVKIYNDREVDELFIFDIDATKNAEGPDIEYLKKITQQCFMPVGYGGGVKSIDDVKSLFEIGFEKVAICTAAYTMPGLMQKAADIFGTQSIVGVIDVLNNNGIRSVFVESGRKKISDDVSVYAEHLVDIGAGELFINSIDRDGMMNGYDLDLISMVSDCVSIPVVACGGAKTLDDCALAIHAGASAVAAGSMFVYWGRKNAVLINYPESKDIVLS
jgi:cyclase